MSEPVNGTNIVLYRHDPDLNQDIPFACARQCALSITPSFRNVTNQSSAWYKEVKRDISEWSVSVEGLVILSNYSYLFLTNLEQTRATILIKFVVDNGTGGLVIYSGSVYPGQFTLTGNYNELGSYSVQLVGTGAYSSSGTQVTPGGIVVSGGSVTRFEYTVITTSATIIIPATIGASVITVFSRATQGMPRIIYSGTPSGDQIKFTTANGTFEAASDNPFLAEEEIWGNMK